MTVFIFLGSKITVDGETAAMKWKDACSLEGKSWQTQNTKMQRYHFVDKGPCSQSYGFFNSHVQMWESDCKEGSVPQNWGFQTVVLEKALESPLDRKEIKPVNPKGNQLGIFIGKTDAEAQTLILRTPDAKSWLIGKNPDAGKDWRLKEKEATDDEMVV